jgi:hypothetical protein
MCLVREITGNGAQTVPDHLTETATKSDDRSTRSERSKEWTDNTSGTLASKVCKEVDDTDHEDKAKREFGGITGIRIHSKPASRTLGRSLRHPGEESS